MRNVQLNVRQGKIDRWNLQNKKIYYVNCWTEFHRFLLDKWKLDTILVSMSSEKDEKERSWYRSSLTDSKEML